MSQSVVAAAHKPAHPHLAVFSLARCPTDVAAALVVCLAHAPPTNAYATVPLGLSSCVLGVDGRGRVGLERLASLRAGPSPGAPRDGGCWNG